MKQTNNTRFKKICIFFISILIVIFSLTVYGKNNITYVNEQQCVHKSIVIKPITNIMQYDSIYIKDSLKNELINEVSKYINKQAPAAYQFIPKYLVQYGLEHNIDICFMMAQTQLETNYGTMGIGRHNSKKSLFGVMKHKYDSYDKSISHYCEILKKYYLVKGKTEKHLLTKYVTYNGGRYAQNPRYEIELTTTYKNIIRLTKINSLQKEYNNL